MIWLGIIWLLIGLVLFLWALHRDNIRLTTVLILIASNMLIQWAYVEFGHS